MEEKRTIVYSYSWPLANPDSCLELVLVIYMHIFMHVYKYVVLNPQLTPMFNNKRSISLNVNRKYKFFKVFYDDL